MWGLLVITALVGLVGAQNGGDSLLVNITQGPVRGYKHTDSDVFVFYGIPYATTPKGRQKFMAPLPPPVWTEPLEAVDRLVICLQPVPFPGKREECLVANVYVPDTNETNLPVLVVVHGGAFHSMAGSFQEPVSLLNKTSNMIVVTFNYRLGVHGFLCLGTEEVPGNAGRKDQVALLRWVRDNIASFGGNPNDVTIEGCSAGGISAGLLTISPMSQGLFHKVIAISGGIAGSITVQLDPIANAKNYAKLFDFENDDLEALEEFYKTASIETLQSRLMDSTNRTDSYIPFAPCVEADLETERFLDDAPVNIMRRQNQLSYPIMYGYSNMEGLFNINNFDTWKGLMNEKFSDFLPADLEFSSDDEREEVATVVKQFYFGNETVSDNTVLSYVDYFTDVLFAFSILRSVTLFSEFSNNTIYLFEYSFVDENTPYVRNTTERGAEHCSQAYVIFEDIFYDLLFTGNYTEEFYAMQEKLWDIYTNFITSGVPVREGSSLPAWPPTNAQHRPHMSIGPTVQLLGPLAHSRFAFWDDIYGKYYKICPASWPGHNRFCYRKLYKNGVL